MSKANPYLAHLGAEPTGKISKRLTIDKPTQRTIQLAKNPQNTFGNYKNYYGYRRGDRLNKLSRSIFADKSVLDVGCNDGSLTLEIYKSFGPSRITGVDIDPELITKARFKKAVQFSRRHNNEWEAFPVSATTQLGVMPIDDDTILFRCSDWLHEPFFEFYDVICAFSVTKWIHLVHGDGGLRFFFNKCLQSLNPGGILILEPQGWEGYEKRARLGTVMMKNYNEITFFPSSFLNFLTKKVGFQHLETIESESVDKFSRLIYILQKPL